MICCRSERQEGRFPSFKFAGDRVRVAFLTMCPISTVLQFSSQLFFLHCLVSFLSPPSDSTRSCVTDIRSGREKRPRRAAGGVRRPSARVRVDSERHFERASRAAAGARRPRSHHAHQSGSILPLKAPVLCPTRRERRLGGASGLTPLEPQSRFGDKLL